MKNKKFFCLAGMLAVVVALGLWLIACYFPRNDEQAGIGEEFPTISILTIGETDPGALERVSAALSEITQERIGCRVELRMIREDEYDERIDNLLLESDFADIFVCRNRTTMNNLMNNSYIYRLDRYLKRCPELRSAVAEESSWGHVQSRGYTYGIPFGNEGASSWGFLMRKDICDELNVNVDSITTLEQLQAVLLRVQEVYPDMIPMVTDYGEAQTFADADLLTAGAGCLIVDRQVVDVCSLPDFQKRCTLLEQWYEQGLILNNGQLNRTGRGNWMAGGLAFGSFARLDRYTARELEYTIGVPVECAVVEGPYYGVGQSDMSFVVYAYTEDVDLCLQVLQLIYTDKEMLKLCVYGQEGVDYTLSPKGAALPTEDCKFINWCWPMRDLVPAPVRNEDPVWYENEMESDFHFDNRAVSNEIYQCGEVLEKYYEALCIGVIDAQEGIACLREELERANQAVVRAELERQWSAWIREN